MAEDRKTGFLIMPFDPQLDWLHGEIVSAAVAEGASIVRADNIFAPGAILGQILDQIDNSDFVVAVCTGKNANVFFELGYAWRSHIPVLVADNSDDLPFDVAAFRTVMYGGSTAADSRETLSFRLRSTIKEAVGAAPLPRGRVVSRPAQGEPAARLRGQSRDNGKNKEFTVSNKGSVELHQVDIEVPSDVGSLFVARDDLPAEVLRPGESFNVPTIGMMGGGPRIFDVKVRGLDPDDQPVEGIFKVSL